MACGKPSGQPVSVCPK